MDHKLLKSIWIRKLKILEIPKAANSYKNTSEIFCTWQFTVNAFKKSNIQNP